MASRAEAGNLESQFLSAALDPAGWDSALRAMADATGSRPGQLIGFGIGAAPFNWISDIDQGIIAKSAVIDIGAPDLNFRVTADRLGEGAAIIHEAHYDMARQSLRADDYPDLCVDYAIFDGCQTRLVANDNMLSGAFDAIDRACWLLDATRRVGGMTARAETLLSGGLLRVTDGWLSSARPEENRRITPGIRAVMEPGGLDADPVALADEAGDVAVMLEFFPLPAKPWSLPFAPCAMIVAKIGVVSDRHVRLLIRTVRLTLAEADIAMCLSNGESRPEIAQSRGVSAETLKVQLRSVYDKTGCRCES